MHVNKFALAAGVFLLSAGAASAATVTTGLNLRAGPGTRFGVIDTMPAGAQVAVLSCTGSWCRVDWRGEEGYASRSFISGEGYAANGGYYAAPAYSYGYGYPDEYGYPYDGDYYDYGPGVVFGYGGGYYGHHRYYRHHRNHHFVYSGKNYRNYSGKNYGGKNYHHNFAVRGPTVTQHSTMSVNRSNIRTGTVGMGSSMGHAHFSGGMGGHGGGHHRR